VGRRMRRTTVFGHGTLPCSQSAAYCACPWHRGDRTPVSCDALTEMGLRDRDTIPYSATYEASRPLNAPTHSSPSSPTSSMARAPARTRPPRTSHPTSTTPGRAASCAPPPRPLPSIGFISASRTAPAGAANRERGNAGSRRSNACHTHHARRGVAERRPDAEAHAVQPVTAVQSECSLWWRQPDAEALAWIESDVDEGLASCVGRRVMGGL
jgi:hypothetical protein